MAEEKNRVRTYQLSPFGAPEPTRSPFAGLWITRFARRNLSLPGFLRGRTYQPFCPSAPEPTTFARQNLPSGTVIPPTAGHLRWKNRNAADIRAFFDNVSKKPLGTIRSGKGAPEPTTNRSFRWKEALLVKPRPNLPPDAHL